MKKVLIFTALLLLAACGNQQEEGKEVTAPMQDISLNVSAKDDGDQAVLTLKVKNESAENKVLTFKTGQTYELTVHDKEGNEVYRYSKGKMFTQAIHKMTLEPGEEKEFQEVWNYLEGTKPGEYKVSAELLGKMQNSGKLTAETSFTIE